MKQFIVMLTVLLVIGGGFAIYKYEHAPIVTYGTSPSTPSEILPGEKSILYRSDTFGFSVAYPQSTTVQLDAFDGTLPLTQIPRVGLPISDALFTGTNLIAAGVFIGVSGDANIVRSCTQPVAAASEVLVGTSQLASTTFSIFTSKGAAAGNVYEATTYRAVHNSSCYEIAEVLHSGNLANYTKGQVTAYDHAKYSAILDTMLKTFVFTDSDASGVQGTVHMNCAAGASGADCTPHIYTIDVDQDSSAVTTIQTGIDGAFRQELSSGQYELRVESASSTHCTSVGVVVPANAFIATNLACDSSGD